MKEEKETSKLMRFSHQYSFWSKFIFCYSLPGQATNLFCLDLSSSLRGEKNHIDGNSLKHEIVLIPSLEKLQGTFCLGNPFDSSLDTNGIPKLSSPFPLISYPESDFITIIAGLPDSWRLLPSKTLNSLADDCCGSVVLSAGTGGLDCRGERLSSKARHHRVTAQLRSAQPSCVFLPHCPYSVACGSRSPSLSNNLPSANSNDTRQML